MAVEKHVDILKARACRDAPNLLGDVPSYKGKLKRKEKEGELSKKAGGNKGGKQQGGKTHQSGGNKKGKEPRVKFPTFRKPTEFWFQESRQTELLGINVPLQIIAPKLIEEMSQRNVVRVNIRDCASARQKSTDPTEPVEKRQKVTHDFFPTKPSTPPPIKKEGTESSVAGGSKAMGSRLVRLVKQRWRSLSPLLPFLMGGWSLLMTA